MEIIVAIILTALGMLVGFWLPDLDLKLTLFGLFIHRSIITHGCIIPLLCFWGINKRSFLLLQPLAVGLSAAMAIHLCFDLFPLRWLGFALIHIPLYGRTTAAFSSLWLALSIVVCLYLLFRWADDGRTLALVAASIAGGFILVAQGNVYMRVVPLIALLIASAVALWLALRGNPYLRQLYRQVFAAGR